MLTDAGLLAHLLGGEEAIERSLGPVLENFVLMEIAKQASVSDTRPPLFHYRTSDGLEVDALVEPRSGPVCAIEVKAAATLTARDARGMKGLAATLGDDLGAGAILYMGSEAVQLSSKMWALPLSALWAAC